MAKETQRKLLTIYEQLYAVLGPSHWWPGETPLEIMVGAILTQNTSWKNVEQALDRLKKEGVLSIPALDSAAEEQLAEWIRPAGYFRVKARRLKNFFRFLQERYAGRIETMADQDPDSVREGLLTVNGIGPETADSILLYGLGMPTFVVDAYTYRLFSRHALIPEEADYEALRAFFLESLPPEVSLYNEYHALIVRTGKRYCRNRNPRCGECPLGNLEL
ncbi:MAG: endonuclease III domain-containing protein [Deltaproteobacteria bacterium]|nr:endonuclease III domain-containing protein [Deltaproteobacteria bacterium]